MTPLQAQTPPLHTPVWRPSAAAVALGAAGRPALTRGVFAPTQGLLTPTRRSFVLTRAFLMLALGLGAWPAPEAWAQPGRAGGHAAPVSAELRAALRKNVNGHGRRFRRCHELAMAEDLRAGGGVTLELAVAPAGVVVDTQVKSNESGNALFARCLVEVTRSFVFPATGTRHLLPITLRFARPGLKLTVRLDDVPARKTGEPGVSLKALLGPHNVTGDRIGLVVARLDQGSTLGLGGPMVVLGVHVLAGSLRLETGRTRPGPASLGLGEGASLQGSGAGAKLVNTAGGRSAALLFVAPGAAVKPWQGPREATPSPGARPAQGGPILLRASSQVVTRDLSLGPSALPVPRVLAVAPGERAVVNPTAADMHHALLVTEGVLQVTLGGETLQVEVGMALYLPGKMSAEAVALHGHAARLVLMPWPGTGSWSPGAVHPLVRFTRGTPPGPQRP